MTTALSSPIAFLTKRCPHPDLLNRFLAHAEDLEIQVNVAKMEGEPIPGKASAFANVEGEQWFNYRIPWNANSEPEFKDYPIRFNFTERVLGIGSTGWDWRNRRSRWLGFDFDSIVGHASGGLSADQLFSIQDAVKAIPWVEVRRSTSGNGLHLYVMVDVPTRNHSEHAALGRYVLGLMSRECGHDLKAAVDVCGSNMWIWHRKMTIENQGLSLLKPAEGMLKETEGWESHIDVVTRRRSNVKVSGVSETDEDVFDTYASAHRRVPLDDKHREIITALEGTGYIVNWVSDYHLLQTHLKAFEMVHEKLSLIGPYSTSSGGTRPNDANCFAFPLDNGAWKIVKFGGPTPETDTWVKGERSTWCLYNTMPPLEVAARIKGGVESEKGSFTFDSVQDAQAAYTLATGQELSPVELNRKATLSDTKDGVVIEVERASKEESCPSGFTSTDGKSSWNMILPKGQMVVDNSSQDGAIRRMETPKGDSNGWCILKQDTRWTNVDKGEAMMNLQSKGMSKQEATLVMGQLVEQPWTLVTKPFENEYPGNREWNRDAPQWAYVPADRGAGLTHPHWDMILDHIGEDLTKYLKNLPWAVNSSINTGGDYMRAIFSSILRFPHQPTPYVFLFGEENAGKSIVHESFELLVTRGVVKADRALTSTNDFNGELAGAILCVVEEKDIGRSPGAQAKIKDAVTALNLSIRRMRMDSYMIPNTSHWVQCSNKADSCPVFPGDTRITMIQVGRIKSEIPKAHLMQLLREEAPAFMRTMVDLELPTAAGRLRIPVVNTEHKSRAADLQRSMLELFMREMVEQGDDKEGIPFADFFAAFVNWLPPDEKAQWNRMRVTRALPAKYGTTKRAGNVVYVPNCELKKQ